MTVERNCPDCGAASPGGAWAGFCPKCLARVSLLPRLFRRSQPTDSAEDTAVSQAEIPARAAPAQDPSLRRFGDYDLLEVIAQGGMGTVWRARQSSVNRIVALKMLRGAEFARPEEAERFRTEAAAVASLQHPHIVALHDFGEHEGQPWFSMDFIEGQTLAEVIRQQPPSPRLAAEWLKAIAEAIAHAHSRGILHRDLKPSNVLLDSQGGLRVTDFGLAKRFESRLGTVAAATVGARTRASSRPPAGQGASPDLTHSGQLLGTPNYAPPEQLAVSRGSIGPASDVYALGAVLYEMLTGRPPFVAETIEATLLQVIDAEPAFPRQLNHSVPADLETICLKCLEKEPARRYPTAQALADELGRYLRAEPILARPVGPLGRLGRWCRRKPGWATAGALGLILLGTVAALLSIGPRRLVEDQRATAAAASSVVGVPVALQQATATFSQPGFPIRDAIDGNTASGGWAIRDASGPGDPTGAQTAVFECTTNIGFPGGSLLTFKLTQNGGSQHMIGRFRLSVTTDDRSTFADGVSSGGDVTANWVILTPRSLASLSASRGAVLTKLEDASVLASSPSPNADIYTITAPTSLTGITGVRLEVLPYYMLPFFGPGLHQADGNFILTELEVDISATAAIYTGFPPEEDDGEPPQQAFKYLDTEFLDSNWEIQVFTEPPSGRASQARISEGPVPPRAFQRITHFLGGNKLTSGVLSIHLNRQATYAPATHGAIAFVDFVEDLRVFTTEFNTFGGSTAPALQQAGALFVASMFFKPARDDQSSQRLPSRWKEDRFPGLREKDFILVSGPMAFEPARHPDFSARGAPIVFGYAQQNSHTSTNAIIRQIDVDNWSVAVYARSAATPSTPPPLEPRAPGPDR